MQHQVAERGSSCERQGRGLLAAGWVVYSFYRTLDTVICGYNSNMTTEQFRATLHLQPFQPFKIWMADGRIFDVAHPDFVAQSHSGRTVIVFHPDENYGVLDLLLMTELQVANGLPA